MQDRAFKNPKIDFLWDTVVVDVLGDTKVSGVRVRDTVTGDERRRWRWPGSSWPSATSPTPLFKGQLEMDENGYIRTLDGTSRTNVDGVFACGDVQDHFYRQAITAAGSGCMAAIDAERWLEDAGE